MRTKSSLLVISLVFTIIYLLNGCSNNKFNLNNEDAAPVIALDSAPTMHGYHEVKEGETLYSIAWRYGRDFKELAQINRIPAPYVISIGQKLSLNATQKPAQSIKNSAVSQDLPRTKTAVITKEEPLVTKEPLAVKEPRIKSQKIENERIAKTANAQWIWPVNGNIIKTYSPKHNKGIDIGGTLGQPVKAANSGKVVYSGSGLRGYGKLIIIKHNETYLSAYAHNNRILVREGENVSQGQTISEMGRTDADQVKLHFEIRKNGQPVNPSTFLKG